MATILLSLGKYRKAVFLGLTFVYSFRSSYRSFRGLLISFVQKLRTDEMETSPQTKLTADIDQYRDILNLKVDELDNLLDKLDVILQGNLYKNYTKESDKIQEHIVLMKNLAEIKDNHENLTISINTKFDFVKIQYKDFFENEHFFIIDFSQPKSLRITEHSLPIIDDLTCIFSDMHSAFDAFNQCLLSVSDYIEVMNDLDTNCWSIDPAYPTFKDNYRRIVIDEEITALITIDIYFAKNPPRIKPLGPTKITDKLSEKLHDSIVEWDPENMFIDNLLNIFGISQFPQKNDSLNKINQQATEVDCCICFSSRDETGQLPSIQCERTICLQNFHPTCLYQWLLAISSNLQGFNTIHGECPNCSTNISCPVAPQNR